MTVTHHDLCFGCGLANVFGLHLEAELADGALSGRFFVKQDHQGPDGALHAGVMAAALEEAMGLALHAAGLHARVSSLAVSFGDPAPVGDFVPVTARIVDRNGGRVRVEAEAGSLASATGEFTTLA